MDKGTKGKPSITVVLHWLLRVLQGALIGAGAILPGISGGVLCVIFGIYQPMMSLLAHPVRTFKKNVKLLLPVLIGCLLGFLGLARLVEWLFKASSNLAIWLFIGLIVGMIPSLFKEAGKEGRSMNAWIAFAVSLIMILAILVFLENAVVLNIRPNIWWYLVCGLLWGISMVVPGLSSSSFIIFLGLYESMVAGIADLSMQVIIPIMVGVVLLVLVSARPINYLFKKHYTVAYHMVLGFVFASTVIIIPRQYEGIGDILQCAGCFMVGFAIAWLIDKAGQKLQAKETDITAVFHE